MTDTKKLRHPSAGGYARGVETRQRIIAAGIACFGERGFAGASTREIATQAGVNAPALQYYFENKEGLYCACMEMIAEGAWANLAPAVERARAVLAAAPDPQAAIDAFLGIQRALTEKLFTPRLPHEANLRLFLAREQQGGEPVSGTSIMMERVRRPLHEVCTNLLACITGEPATSELTQLRVFSVLGQHAVFHAAPRTTLALLGWPAFDAEHGARLVDALQRQTRELLSLWHRARGDSTRTSAGSASPSK
jgi:TetR/AcrR family transcriptional regulator, regulator of cefoperazone and chloramphenicol sensitivity